MPRRVTPTGSSHKLWQLAVDRGLVEEGEARAELARQDKRRKSARAARDVVSSEDRATPDAAAYSAHVFRPHRPRAQSRSSVQRRHDRRQKRLKRYQERQRALLERYRTELVRQGQRDAAPRPIPLKAWSAVQLLRSQSAAKSAKARKILMAQVPRWYAERIRKAAYRPAPARPRRQQALRDEVQRRDASSRAALRTIDMGLFLWLVSEPTGRRGVCRVVRGLGRGVFQSALRDFHTGQYACLSSLFGIDPRAETPGSAPALEQAGAIHYSQIPPDRARAADKGPSGWAFNVYWIRRRPGRASPFRQMGEAFEGIVPDPLWQQALEGPLEPDGTTTYN